MKKLWAFNDLIAAISAALHDTFGRSKYANSVSQLLLYWMRIICCIYKDFVRQLKAFLPSFCHLCACEMSPGWGHLITWMDPSVEHLNSILARVGGNLNNNFQKSQMPGGLPGGDVEASIWPIHKGQILIYLFLHAGVYCIKYCVSSNYLFYLRAADWPTTNFLRMYRYFPVLWLNNFV